MSRYYLMAQLPSLDALSDSAPVPITEERFTELCARFLGKRSIKILNQLTLIPERKHTKTGSTLLDKWNDEERSLRLALGQVRAEKLNKSFDSENREFSAELLKTVRAAAESEDPLNAEQLLNRYRLDFLESLRPSDAFSEDSVFYYGLKLKLILRIRTFDREKGREQYKNIFSSIMSREEQKN